LDRPVGSAVEAAISPDAATTSRPATTTRRAVLCSVLTAYRSEAARLSRRRASFRLADDEAVDERRVVPVEGQYRQRDGDQREAGTESQHERPHSRRSHEKHQLAHAGRGSDRRRANGQRSSRSRVKRVSLPWGVSDKVSIVDGSHTVAHIRAKFGRTSV
jgi:hypothetical protein